MYVRLDSFCPDNVKAFDRMPNSWIIQKINGLFHSAKWYILHAAGLNYIFEPRRSYEANLVFPADQISTYLNKWKYIARAAVGGYNEMRFYVHISVSIVLCA